MAESCNKDKLKSLESLDQARAIASSPSEISYENLAGHECEFVSQPPNRTECPICLLVLREPHQATCCGKIFCKTCICRLRDKKKPCPTCKTEDFSCYPDKGLKQELYSSRVYCPKRSLSCDWQGELGELDKHLDGDGKDTANLEGCKFVTINCSFCSKSYPRGELEEHQMKCRPVDCPNKCGQVMQHQKLEEHLSSECELSEVECEFSHAGCEAKMLRRDLLSHMTDNMAAHMSQLARENRQLKNKVTALEIENKKLAIESIKLAAKSKTLASETKTLAAETKNILDRSSLVPTQYIRYPWSSFVYCNNSAWPRVKSSDSWLSKPFYTSLKGPSVQLCIWNSQHTLCFKFVHRNPDKPSLHISTSIQTPTLSKSSFNKIVWYGYEQKESETVQVKGPSRNELSKNCHDTLIFCINHVEHVEIFDDIF